MVTDLLVNFNYCAITRWGKLFFVGSTVSIILITGCLLTAANVGDSAAVIDTGCSFLELTDSHRIHDHVSEKERLLTAGCTLAQLGFHLEGPARPKEPGFGPLRIWPGGLCVSRSIGDIRAGPEIVPLPHIKQVRVFVGFEQRT